MRAEITETRRLYVNVWTDDDLEALMDVEARYGGGEVNLDEGSGADVECKVVAGCASKVIGRWTA